MQIESVPFTTTDWASLPETTHAGETGVATWRTVEMGNIRVRMVRVLAGLPRGPLVLARARAAGAGG